MLGGDCHTAIGAHWSAPRLLVFCFAASGVSELAFEAEERHLREFEELLERERGFYHGHFEALKSTTFARSLYIALRAASFETLISWQT
jgi:hypothetical protein